MSENAYWLGILVVLSPFLIPFVAFAIVEWRGHRKRTRRTHDLSDGEYIQLAGRQGTKREATVNHQHDEHGPFGMCGVCWRTKIAELTGDIYHPLKSIEQMAAEAAAMEKPK